MPAPPSIETWLDLLRQWNARIDLTAARSEDELRDLMLADATMLAERIPQGAKVVDVGSGAGAPGLALALLRPDLAMTLVEPLTKRVSFLRTVIGTVGRTDIRLLRERADALTEQWEVAISRATLPPAEWIEVGLRLAPSVWTLLAREEPPATAAGELVDDFTYGWPLTAATRRAILHRRIT